MLQVIDEAQQALQDEPLIGHPLSLKNLIDVLPGDPAAEQRMSLIELLPTDLKRAFYVPEEHGARINFRVRDLCSNASGRSSAGLPPRIRDFSFRSKGKQPGGGETCIRLWWISR